jgi:hypothetical protein
MIEQAPPDGQLEGSLGDEDVFGTEVYEAPLPSKREFLPWHRPRKQFVRDRQWCGEIRTLLDGRSRDDGTFRYLGLPGADLLDLRYFHNAVCEPRKLRLRFLGFNSAANPQGDAQTDLNISLDEVRKLAYVDPTSDVIWDDFSQLANQRSLAWKRARDFGPYDVINLDLCDGFGAQPPDVIANTHYSAISSLLSLQARSKHPWLMLLTTRAGHAFLHEDVRNALIRHYRDNLASCTEFLRASRECFAIATDAEVDSAVAEPAGMLHVSLVGVCKWFIGLTSAQRPPSKVDVRSAIGYRVHPAAACEDLMSLAIRIEPTFIPVGDRMGLASRRAAVPDECLLAERALRRVFKRKDADALLAAKPALWEELVNQTAALLELARYDSAAYREWLAQPVL